DTGQFLVLPVPCALPAPFGHTAIVTRSGPRPAGPVHRPPPRPAARAGRAPSVQLRAIVSVRVQDGRMVGTPHRALDGFSPATRGWFSGAFSAPTAAQAGAWQAIHEGSDVLVVAPTGSGKTL